MSSENELYKIFGTNTDLNELGSDIDVNKTRSTINQMKNRFGSFTISQEILDKSQDPAWRAEQRRLRQEEDVLELTGQEPSQNNMQIFTPDSVYLKSKGAGENRPYNIRAEYAAILDSKSYKPGSMMKMLTTPRSMSGYEKSISSVTRDPELYKEMEQIQFIKYVNAQGIDFRKIDDNVQRHLWEKFIQSKRIRLDMLMESIMKEVEGYFMTIVLPDMPVEYINRLQATQRERRTACAMMVQEQGPLLEMNQLGLMAWYFDRYGFSQDDAKYFNRDVMSYRENVTIGKIMDDFKAIVGYEFKDVYIHFYNQYMKNLQKTNKNNADDNDTVLVKEDDIPHEEVIDFEDEEILEDF